MMKNSIAKIGFRLAVTLCSYVIAIVEGRFFQFKKVVSVDIGNT